jgi:hypothetical protein
MCCGGAAEGDPPATAGGTDLNSTIAAVTRLLPLPVLTPLAKADLFVGRLR